MPSPVHLLLFLLPCLRPRSVLLALLFYLPSLSSVLILKL
ncbi:hypothetical protein NC651_002028 [Populus alba x Populus x berolinensis]|nr:hypothetical protein NC651_002028 [Populus alba x Populus x berolinensis]